MDTKQTAQTVTPSIATVLDASPISQYVGMLKTHDWLYQNSGDGATWAAGRDSHKALMAKAKALDSQFEIWNHYAPFAHRRTAEDAIIARRIKELM